MKKIKKYEREKIPRDLEYDPLGSNEYKPCVYDMMKKLNEVIEVVNKLIDEVDLLKGMHTRYGP